MEVPGPATPPKRLLLGPGPSPVHTDVLQAQARGVVGHLDAWFLAVTDQIAGMLRAVFRTDNPLTYAVSGTGSAGMETALANVVEPGDAVVVGINGVFGARIAETVMRHGGKVVPVEAPWGEIVPPGALLEAVEAHPDAVAVAVVHAETSTGAWQPLEELGGALADRRPLLVVDAVTSLAGVPVDVDGWGLDVVPRSACPCLPGWRPSPSRPGPSRSSRVAARRSDRGTSTRWRWPATGAESGPTTTRLR